MNGFVGTIQNQFYSAYDWAEEVGTTVHHQVSSQVQRTKIYVIDFGQECQHTLNRANRVCVDTVNKVIDTVNKIEDYLYYHKETIFLFGCSLTTAYFAPHLFFPTVIVSVVVRIELSRNLKKIADYYLRDERNPYQLNPKYNTCVNTVDVALGAIAALDAIALGTIFMTNFWTVYLIPVLGGIVAGNCSAKCAMNFTNLLGSSPNADLSPKPESDVLESESPKTPSLESPSSASDYSPFNFNN